MLNWIGKFDGYVCRNHSRTQMNNEKYRQRASERASEGTSAIANEFNLESNTKRKTLIEIDI